MTTELPQATDTAVALAVHPRFDLREGMLMSPDGAMDGWRFCYRDDLGFYFSRRSRIYVLTDTQVDLSIARLTPDLSDDATVGILRGMIWEWGSSQPGVTLLTVSALSDGDAFVGVEVRNHVDGSERHAHAKAPSVGEAVGRCLLACWALDAEEGR